MRRPSVGVYVLFVIVAAALVYLLGGPLANLGWLR